jgi:hypothetical protein
VVVVVVVVVVAVMVVPPVAILRIKATRDDELEVIVERRRKPVHVEDNILIDFTTGVAVSFCVALQVVGVQQATEIQSVLGVVGCGGG